MTDKWVSNKHRKGLHNSWLGCLAGDTLQVSDHQPVFLLQLSLSAWRDFHKAAYCCRLGWQLGAFRTAGRWDVPTAEQPSRQPSPSGIATIEEAARTMN